MQDESVLQALHNIKQVAAEIQACLERGDLDEFAQAPYIIPGRRNAVWLPGLSTGFIDECYTLALERGASAGKITGAGGGGFLLIYCHEQAQDAVTRALEDRGLKRMNFRFDHTGATVVLNMANFNQDWVVPYSEPPFQESQSENLMLQQVRNVQCNPSLLKKEKKQWKQLTGTSLSLSRWYEPFRYHS